MQSEKYGKFLISNIVFYDKEEFQSFIDSIKSIYGDYISKVNGKKRKGSGKFGFRTKEELDNLSLLDLSISADNLSQTVTISGYGHRRLIMKLELLVRQRYDQKRIVCYNVSDTLNRESDISYSIEEGKKAEKNWEEENRMRYEMWKEGKFSGPEKQQNSNDTPTNEAPEL